MKLRYLLLSAVLCFSVPLLGIAKEDENIYLGYSFSAQVYKDSRISEDFYPVVSLGKLGVEVNRFLSFETRFGFNSIADSKVVSNSTMEFKNNGMFGIYAKGKLGLTRIANLYLLAGATIFDASFTNANNSFDGFNDDQSGLSLGAGLESNFYGNWMLNVELINYVLRLDEYALTGIEFGVGYLF